MSLCNLRDQSSCFVLGYLRCLSFFEYLTEEVLVLYLFKFLKQQSSGNRGFSVVRNFIYADCHRRHLLVIKNWSQVHWLIEKLRKLSIRTQYWWICLLIHWLFSPPWLLQCLTRCPQMVLKIIGKTRKLKVVATFGFFQWIPG